MAIRTSLNTSSRKNDEEKFEKTIRSLAKLPENRRCINCASLGPQYVCTNFAIFVCTACSGIHREFTHRIKSISMAKFTAEEVVALQEGGNERARDVFFRDWDPHKFPLPDSGNPDKLREFIKNVYIEKRYTGGDRGPPRRSERDDPRRPSPRRASDMRSPRYGETRRYEEPVVDRRRSNEGRSSFDGNDDRRFMGSPASVFSAPATLSNERERGGRRQSQHERERGGGPNDRRHDERNRGSRYDDRDRDQYDDRYARGEDRRAGGGYDDRRDSRKQTYRDTDEFGSPPIQPVSSILGEGYGNRSGRFEGDYASPVHPKRGIRTTRGEVEQSSGSTPNSAGHQRVNSGNLIDWSLGEEDPAVVATAATPVAADPFGGSLSAPAGGNSAGWATFDTGSTNGPAPATGFGGDSFAAAAANGGGNWAGFGSQPPPQSVQNAPGVPGSGGAEWSAFGSTVQPQMGGGQEWSGLGPSQQGPPGSYGAPQQAPPGSFGAPQQAPLGSFGAPQQAPPGSFGAPQPAPPGSFGAPQQALPGSFGTPQQAPPGSYGAPQHAPSGSFQQPTGPPQQMPVAQQPPSSQGPPSKGLGRQEIPEDFFAQPSFAQPPPMSYGSPYAPPGGPQSFPPGGPASMGPPQYMQPAKTKNPFDLPGDPPSGPSSSAFPSMGTMQSALPSYHSGPFSNPGPGSGPSSGQWGPSSMSSGGAPHNNMMTPPVMTQPNSMGPASMGAGQGPYSVGPGSFGAGMPPGYGAPQQQYAAQMPVAGNPFG